MPNPSWSPNGAWTSVFDDEFPGSSLDTTKWAPGWFASSGVSGPINSNETVKYNSSNVTVSGGLCNLALTASQGACISTNPQFASPGFTFTPPAAFEARCFLPTDPTSPFGIDNWPAFWADTTGSWPAGVEVDVMEGLGDFAAYHIHDSSGGPGANVGSVTSYVGWHTFGANWDSSGLITFYYDGVQVGTLTTVNKSPGTHYLICDYTTSSTPDPAVMNVDWVRCWTPGGGTGGSGSNATGTVVTATTSGAGAAPGLALTVTVLNGAAAVQSGATASTATALLPELAITPNSTGSLVFGSMIYNAASNKFTGLASTTYTQNASDTVNGVTYGTYQSAATTTASSPVTLGSAIPTGTSGEILIAQAEIQAAGGSSLSVDPSTPAIAYITSARTLSTGSFNPPGGALIVAQVASDYSGTGSTTTVVSDSSGLTWTELVHDTDGVCSVWMAGAASGSPVTGPPPVAVTEQLIVAVAPQSGTDQFGNKYPQGILVGQANQPQVQIIPPTTGSSAAQMGFPMPIGLAQVPNVAGGMTGTYAAMLLSGPALNVANDEDWVQLVLFSNQSGSSANGQLRYVSSAGVATLCLQWDANGLFIPTVGSAPATPSGGVRLYYRAGALRAKGPSGNEITIATT